MPTPFPLRFRLPLATVLLGLMTLLSCQNDVTAPLVSPNVVSGQWPSPLLRLPDSAAWGLHDTTGTFVLTVSTTDTSFHVQAILPRGLGPNDTLGLSAFTLSIRTTFAL